jgi:hypothetical protein
MEEYLALERELLRLRQNPQRDEQAEDSLLEQMDYVWWRLSKEQQAAIKARHKTDGPSSTR